MSHITTSGGLSARLSGLLRAAHAPPSAAVTLMVTMFAVRAELSVARVLVVAGAVGLGQLSIGWLNDWWDTEGDRRSARMDKPIVVGAVGRRTVGTAAVVAGVGSAVLSLLLGSAGIVNMVHVIAGYSYDVWAKRTLASVVPYIVAFGVLPAVATLAQSPPVWPPAWIMLAGASLGIGGHFANALPDLEQDLGIGDRGLPQALGFTWSLAVAAASLGAGVAAVAVAVLTDQATSGATRIAAIAALLGSAVMLAGIVATALGGNRRLAFRLTMLLAVVTVGMLVAGPSHMQ